MEKFEAGQYDVIVVGAGHAGCEAALASARLGCKTLLVTISLEMVAFMPCNPSIGGPAKGVVVREIDALGGQMGKNIDQTYIQMRLLNTGKGPAVQALRAQADKASYSVQMKETLENQVDLDLKQAMVDQLLIEDGECHGVITSAGAIYRSKSVVLTTGTSSRGRIIIGELNYASGPNNTLPSVKLSHHLQELGLDLVRFKTGTPPRVHRDSVDFDQTEEQPGDQKPNHFSYETPDEDYLQDSISCWLTHTNDASHEVIRQNLDRSPMFSGMVEGVGARYCPSIEDKIVRFSDKPRHQIFIEPEGRHTKEMYVQGLSTSLPEDVQLQILHQVPGLKRAELMRPGYAIEYDVLVPHQLTLSLEVRQVPGLFTAGQMNGTSGYEEAAGQGIIAGINAAHKALDKEAVIIPRSQAYIGVMIDDLVTKGTTEPYRLLTSRAEHRLLLRHDNADLRLSELAYSIGLLSEDRYQAFIAKQQAVADELDRLAKIRLTTKTPGLAEYFQQAHSTPLKDGILASELLKRPEITYAGLASLLPPAPQPISRQVAEQVEIQIKYEGYIRKALHKIDKVKAMESKKIPEDIDYDAVDSLATEARERLKLIQPENIGQASRISGVNPADIAILSIYIQQGKIARVSDRVNP